MARTTKHHHQQVDVDAKTEAEAELELAKMAQDPLMWAENALTSLKASFALAICHPASRTSFLRRMAKVGEDFLRQSRSAQHELFTDLASALLEPLSRLPEVSWGDVERLRLVLDIMDDALSPLHDVEESNLRVRLGWS